MDVREIADLKNAQPFVPFNILMADGREFAVNHPDFIARSPTGRSVVLYDATDVHYLDVRLIAELRHPESRSIRPLQEASTVGLSSQHVSLATFADARLRRPVGLTALLRTDVFALKPGPES